MRLLCAVTDAKERARIVSVLGSHHEVVEAATSAVAARLWDQAFEVAVVDAVLVARARQVAERIYVIAVVKENPTSSDYQQAYAAGADDVMRSGAPRDEVVGRASALARIRTWTAPPQSIASRLDKFELWGGLDALVAGEIGELLGQDVKPSASASGTVVIAAELPLTLTAEKIQLRLGFGIDEVTLVMLQAGLLGGDTSPEAAADALREIANTAGGVLKRRAMAVGLELTIGLPVDKSLVANDQVPGEHRAWTLESASGVQLACTATAMPSVPKVVGARDLKEGMVLASDVRNLNGVLIAPAGTNLTTTTVEQLARLLGSHATVEVNEIAA